MTESKRCPNCGGLNPIAAEWCGQCLQRFKAKAPSVPPGPAAVPPSAPPGLAGAGTAVGELAAPVGTVVPEAARSSRGVVPGITRGAFKVRGGGVVWTCSRCDTENDLEHLVCSVCGTSFADVVEPKPERPQRDPGMAAMLSLLFPGAGHGYQGLWGEAVARAVLSTWVVFVAAVSLWEGARLGSRLVALVFASAAAALWAIAAHDAYREARNETGQVILRARGFLYVVLALLVTLLVLLTVGGLRPG